MALTNLEEQALDKTIDDNGSQTSEVYDVVEEICEGRMRMYYAALAGLVGEEIWEKVQEVTNRVKAM